MSVLQAPELLLGGGLAASFSGLIVATVCAHRRGQRLGSLAKPLHELRGALTALQLGLPARSAGNDALAPQLERARLALDDLDACLEDKPGAHGELSTAELVDLEALVIRGVRSWSQLASGFGGHVRVRWRAGGVLVMGRSGRLAQAVDNLIANALEHGGGRVLVEGELAGSKVRVAVIDRGQGVSLPAKLGEAVVTSRRGHGLAITREVVAAHGGRLRFERRGQGAAVMIELPVADPDAVRAQPPVTKPVSVHASTSAPRAA
jgi:signal transduction histidine kinase